MASGTHGMTQGSGDLSSSRKASTGSSRSIAADGFDRESSRNPSTARLQLASMVSSFRRHRRSPSSASLRAASTSPRSAATSALGNSMWPCPSTRPDSTSISYTSLACLAAVSQFPARHSTSAR
jgi:hypothetical protein